MLALVEPLLLSDDIAAVPHLGCAMLIAACERSGITTTLVPSQTRVLKDMCVDQSEELWHLLVELRSDGIKKIGIEGYVERLREKGQQQFRQELKSLYEYVIADKNPQHFFNARKITDLARHYAVFSRVYEYYLSEQRHARLSIVENYLRKILHCKPRYVGFSLQEVENPFFQAVGKCLRQTTEVKIIAGGALTPFLNLKRLHRFFRDNTVDYLVIGAGELALPALIDAVEARRPLSGITNLAYRCGRRIKVNSLGVIENLDALAIPDYSQFTLDRYLTPRRILPLQTVRGCVWRKCAFCSHHHIYRDTYKTFSAERVVETLRSLCDRYDCRHFSFHDEGLPPAWAEKLSRAILMAKFENVAFTAFARPVGGYTRPLLALMRKAGFVSLHWGVESGSQKILDLMRKGTRKTTIGRVLENSSAQQIANICFLLQGFPGETAQDVLQTVAFLKKHAGSIAGILKGFFQYMPDAPLGRDGAVWARRLGVTTRALKRDPDNIPAAVKANWIKFLDELEVNSSVFMRDDFHFLPALFNMREMVFFNAGQCLLPSADVLRHLREGRADSFFPVFLGETQRKGRRMVFFPIRVNDSMRMNHLLPPKPRYLDALEQRVYALSKGTLSAQEIIARVCADLKPHAQAHAHCAAFFEEVFQQHYALGYAQSWRAPELIAGD